MTNLKINLFERRHYARKSSLAIQAKVAGRPIATQAEGTNMASTTFIESYSSLRIYHDAEDGYYASNGPAVHFGYADTVEEIRSEIDDYWSGDEHGELNGFFADRLAA